MSAIASTAPVLVVPAEATTRKGSRPAPRSSRTMARNRSTSIRSSGVVGTTRMFRAPNPARDAALFTDAWT